MLETCKPAAPLGERFQAIEGLVAILRAGKSPPPVDGASSTEGAQNLRMKPLIPAQDGSKPPSVA